jgi:hypothetical protein
MPVLRSIAAIILVTTVVLCRVAAAQQPAPRPAGHWTGSIEAGPGIAVEVDLAAQPAGTWRGTISIPSQGTKGVPLADLAVKDGTVEFAIKGAPGDPRFKGQVAADGKTISGTFTQGGGSVPMSLAWKGEAVFETPQKSAPLSKEFLGAWEGTLDVKGTMLRLVLTLANGADGATGTLVSVDQGGVEIPISAITHKGAHLNVAVSMISGAFDGDLKGGELTGTWTQGPLSLPLVFKRRQ